MSASDYLLTVMRGVELQPTQLEQCFAIISEGEAVNVDTMVQVLPRSPIVAIVEANGCVVGVGAIKCERREYAAAIFRKAGVEAVSDRLELGYVAVHVDHRGGRLSHRIVEALLARCSGPLFATTDSWPMKRSLEKYGFVAKGSEWTGQRAMLSYWERPSSVD